MAVIPEPNWEEYDKKVMEDAKTHFDLKTITLKAAEVQTVEFKVGDEEIKEGEFRVHRLDLNITTVPCLR